MPKQWITPSKEEIERRNTVNINDETVTNITSTNYPYHWPGEDHSWSIETFRAGLSIQIHENTPLLCNFSLVGVDASIANAIRRILISEIPTLAIEHVFIEENTSVIQDEVLAHRLGLIPFTGSKTGIRDFMKWWKDPNSTSNAAVPGVPGAGGIGLGPGMQNHDPFATSFDNNTAKLKLEIECTHNQDNKDPDEKDVHKLYNHAHVYAKDLIYEPLGRQTAYFEGEDAIRPTNPDILIAKLRPGQKIGLECHMHKGIGSDHAKFSPVATATYRLLPDINILSPILGADAEKFARCFPTGVIAIDKVGRKEAKNETVITKSVSPSGKHVVKTEANPLYGKVGEKIAVVKDPMRDTVSRECLRHDEFKGKVKLGRKMDHFVFGVESLGQWDGDELVLEALKILKGKATAMGEQVERMIRP